MSDEDDLENLRRDDDEWDQEDSRADQPGNLGSPSMVAITTKVATYPTTAQVFYGVRAMTVTGAEVEGRAGTFTTGPTKVFYALNLGSTAPPVGSYVVITYVEDRWIFRYG